MRRESRTQEDADGAKSGTQAVDRALDILSLISRKAPITVGEISEECGLTLPTAHRLVKSLARRGLASLDQSGRGYSLGPEVIRLAHTLLRGNSLVELARPGLKDLNDASGETTSLFSLGANDVLCIAEVESDQSLRYRGGVGRTQPLVRGAPGKAAIAWLDDTQLAYIARSAGLGAKELVQLERELAQIRKQGYAMSDGEITSECAAVAMAILDEFNRPVGVISIAGPSTRWDGASREAVVPLLRDVTGTISRRLGG